MSVTVSKQNIYIIFLFKIVVYNIGNDLVSVRAVFPMRRVDHPPSSPASQNEKEIMEIIRFDVGDILVMKKKHPCGTEKFRVLRVGSDIRTVCTGCGRDLTLPREKIVTENAFCIRFMFRSNSPKTARICSVPCIVIVISAILPPYSEPRSEFNILFL